MRAYERLIRYAGFPTASKEAEKACPTSVSQLEFGKFIVEEMRQIGIIDAQIDQNGYVFGTIESNCDKKCPVLGFIAHMDVVDDLPYENVRPAVAHSYDGGDIVLNREKNIVLSPSEYETLKRYVGCDLVVTDGTTLLGADDKAGIAEIMTFAEYLLAHPEIPHGRIRIGFTPDEEIGRGADLFDVERFGADFAYTVDGGGFGEVEYETFNAFSADIEIIGRNIHPGNAKGLMKNACLIASEFISALPAGERPENTEKYEGFYHLTSVNAAVEKAELRYILRDHDYAKVKARADNVLRVCGELNARYGEGTARATVRESYRNMAEKIIPHNRHLIDNAYAAVTALGGVPVSPPVRGGTDGSRLSFMGLPCPNLGTGSHNHHSRMEYAVVQEMDRCVMMLVELAKIYSEYNV